MKKKKLQELIENAKQNEKVIYQRYNGLITKYIDNGDYYIGCNTGIAIEKNEHLLLGKVSENVIDLIENKDILKVRIDKTIMAFGIDEDTSDIKYKELIENIENGEYELLEILTHEQFKANCYKVGGEDE